MGRLFGTDGIRGQANRYPMTAEMAVAAGRAMAVFFKKPDKSGPVTVVIGKDTRQSGDMLESGLCAGLCAMEADVYLAGVFPTPGIAYLTVSMGADAGIVVSASHNPFMDNGIKIFNREGHKLSVPQEAEIETLILSCRESSASPGQPACGRIHRLKDADIHYADFLKKSMAGEGALPPFPDGIKLVIDCANGAVGGIAKRIFTRAVILSAAPDGMNINNGCGSEHPDNLCRQVIEQRAAAGFAFDGDGDRVVAVDENGHILSGDRILAICAGYLKENGRLRNNTVVSTVMSNIGLTRALRQMDIAHVTTDVGDRHVLETMLSRGSALGGEDSGHIILSDHQTTGDGLLTALMICHIMAGTHKPLSVLASTMTVCPQELVNVPVREKPDLRTIKDVRKTIAAVEASLGESGRVLVRYSGTQPLCRVMAEAATAEEARRAVIDIAEAIRRHIGD
ncbi:MAG: phosphoglucosamine mutase [Thermodesulfobacteriota bacterium]